MSWSSGTPTLLRRGGRAYRRFAFLSYDAIIDADGRAWVEEVNTNGFLMGTRIPRGWDYTLDALMYANDWTLSPIFDDDWFGKASPESTDHIITTGRWAYLTVEKLTTDVAGFSKVHNPYNLLRSPWNTNPTPYVTRYRYVDGLMDGGATTRVISAASAPCCR